MGARKVGGGGSGRVRRQGFRGLAVFSSRVDLMRIELDADGVRAEGLAFREIDGLYRRHGVDLQLHLVAHRVQVVHGEGRSVIDAPVRVDAEILQPLESVAQIVKALVGEGNMVQTCRIAPRSAFAAAQVARNRTVEPVAFTGTSRASTGKAISRSAA